MNIVIDIGNSRTKLALFKHRKLLKMDTVDSADENLLIESLDQMPGLSGLAVAMVKEISEELRKRLQTYGPVLWISSLTKTPLINSYETPETLGVDRIAACVGAADMYPGEDILVIDAGSCITYDIVKKGKEYLGGIISPGLNMRARAMNEFTGKLPLVSPLPYPPHLIGKTTETSLLSGICNGTALEMDAIIDRFKEEYPDLRILITGGDTKVFDKKLKNSIFAVPNLVLLGLNIILEYN